MVSAQSLVTVEPETSPFWVTKAKIQKRINEDGDVVVSVTEKTPGLVSKHQLYLQGVGITKAPLSHVDAVARDFSKYPKMSTYVKSAEFDTSQNKLKMTTEAFHYRADLHLKIEFRNISEKEKQIRFRVLEGVFKDMNGVLKMQETAANQTTVSFTGAWDYEKLPIPRFFVEFGMEVALKMMATRMRAFVMEHYEGVPK